MSKSIVNKLLSLVLCGSIFSCSTICAMEQEHTRLDTTVPLNFEFLDQLEASDLVKLLDDTSNFSTSSLNKKTTRSNFNVFNVYASKPIKPVKKYFPMPGRRHYNKRTVPSEKAISKSKSKSYKSQRKSELYGNPFGRSVIWPVSSLRDYPGYLQGTEYVKEFSTSTDDGPKKYRDKRIISQPHALLSALLNSSSRLSKSIKSSQFNGALNVQLESLTNIYNTLIKYGFVKKHGTNYYGINKDILNKIKAGINSAYENKRITPILKDQALPAIAWLYVLIKQCDTIKSVKSSILTDKGKKYAEACDNLLEVISNKKGFLQKENKNNKLIFICTDFGQSKVSVDAPPRLHCCAYTYLRKFVEPTNEDTKNQQRKYLIPLCNSLMCLVDPSPQNWFKWSSECSLKISMTPGLSINSLSKDDKRCLQNMLIDFVYRLPDVNKDHGILELGHLMWYLDQLDPNWNQNSGNNIDLNE